jgi:retron-type reverse transcriptase
MKATKAFQIIKKGWRMLMKRQGNIYQDICNIENIREAIIKASKGKKSRKNVQMILKNIDSYALKIQAMLKNKTYAPSQYAEETIKEVSNGKERVIYKPKYYPDQIIHWCLMLQIQRIVMKGMYKYCCGSIPNRGIHYALKGYETLTV